MRDLSAVQMRALQGGFGWTWCGIALGATIGATLLYGGVGFALTVNKAFVACTLPAVL